MTASLSRLCSATCKSVMDTFCGVRCGVHRGVHPGVFWERLEIVEGGGVGDLVGFVSGGPGGFVGDLVGLSGRFVILLHLFRFVGVLLS